MRRAVTRFVDGAAAIGFVSFGVLLIGVGMIGVVNGSLLGLLIGGIGAASGAAAWETWTGHRFRFRPAIIVGVVVVSYLVLTVIALQNIGP